MAGGVGSRFWPMSTPQRPKQFVDVLGCGRSLIQLTFDRFRKIIPAQNTWVVTSASYLQIVREQLPEVPWNHVLLEPCRRNTAPCIAYASWRIKSEDPKANIVVTPSDALVLDTAEYQRVISSSLKFVSESDAMVTLGMKPTRPETGYGYIQADLSFSTARNKEMFRVDSFREKPDIDTAKRYIQKNNFFWNAGIFIWNVGTIANALRVYQPALSQIFEDLLPVYGTAREQEAINEVFPTCENISIDYAVMEKAEEIYVFPASFGWSDLGTWGSLHENSATSTATPSSDRTSRCTRRQTASFMPARRSASWCRAWTATSWQNATTRCSSAAFPTNSASSSSARKAKHFSSLRHYVITK